MADAPVVVKVGGSLYDVPDLGSRLGRWLKELGRCRVVLVPGGGPTADVIRTLDHCHGLGDERAHWLALRALTLNAWFLATLLPHAVVTDDPTSGPPGSLAILDAHAFAQADEGRPWALPHSWTVTSDALAARVAAVAGARLILLKSVTVPDGLDWRAAERLGMVDAAFADIVDRHALEVRAVNLREGHEYEGVSEPLSGGR
jgi:aspartokinase-like uncharacterized kinase